MPPVNLKNQISYSIPEMNNLNLSLESEYVFRVDKSIALAMVKPDLANVGEKLKVDILGKMYEATIVEESPYDAENKLLRA